MVQTTNQYIIDIIKSMDFCDWCHSTAQVGSAAMDHACRQLTHDSRTLTHDMSSFAVRCPLVIEKSWKIPSSLKGHVLLGYSKMSKWIQMVSPVSCVL